VSELFTTNTPDQHNWTLNSYLGAFRSVQMHLGQFRYCTNIGAKQAEQVQLVQKFVQLSCVVIFRNECTPSKPLDTKLMFRCVLKCLRASGTVSLLHKTRCKTGRTGAINAKFLQRSHIAILHKEHTRSRPLDPKLIFWCVS